jgi:site-specific DNA recombinase
MEKRAILYARVSGDDRGNDGRNLAGQLDMCREYAERQGWHVVEELAEDDRGASGASFELPQLDRIRDMANNGEFDILVVREVDRLSRNLAKQLIVEEELKRTGVQIDYALADYPDTPEGRLNKHIRATIAEYEREKITERMTRGRLLKVRAGNVMPHGQTPYGYTSGEVDGKTMLIVHEPEAKIVRAVFTWFVHGDESGRPLSIRAITRKLEGVPTRQDISGRRGKRRGYGEWSKSTIHGMLKNETYAGAWRYSKCRGKPSRNPIDRQTVVEVPAIISRDLWKAAQERCLENKKTSKRNRKYRYLLSGRLTCGECGAKLIGHTCVDRRYGREYAYYHCPALNYPEHYPGHTCTGMRFRVDQVDEVIWEWISSLLREPQTLEEALIAQKEKREEENGPIRGRLDIVGDLLADNQRQLERLLDLYLNSDFSKDVLMDRKGRLESTIEGLEKERANLCTHLKARTVTAEQIQSIQDFALKMAKGLTAVDTDDSFELRQQILDQLHLQAILSVEDGVKVAHACCILGEDVFQIASGTTRTRSRAGSPCRGRPCTASRTSGPVACVCSGWSWAGREQRSHAASCPYCTRGGANGQVGRVEPLPRLSARRPGRKRSPAARCPPPRVGGRPA